MSTLTGYIGDRSIRSSALIAAARLQDEPDVVRGLVAAALRYGSWTLILDGPDWLPRDVIAAIADSVTLWPGNGETAV